MASNRNYDAGPRPHGLFSDRDRHGNPRIAVTAARKGESGGGGRPLKILAGHDRDLAYPYLSSIFYDHTGDHLAFDAKSLPQEYRVISEDAALHMMLLMDVVRGEPDRRIAQTVAQAVADMNHLEASWWYAQHRSPNRRPGRALQALTVMHT